MQRYRVNYVLLVGLLVGSVVAAGSIYGVWKWRMTGNAENLLDRATQAEADGKLRESISLLNRYLYFRPSDDEARIKQAMLLVDYADELLKEKEYHEFNKVRANISDALFKYSGEQELRRHYVDLLRKPQLEQVFAKEALDHVKVLQMQDPDDVELVQMQARCLVYLKQPNEAVEVLNRLVGYDSVADEFSMENALTPNDVASYRLLARTLLQQLERPKLALRVEEQMVEVNPESADAYLEYGQFLAAIDEGPDSRNDYGEQASEALAKAYELDPTKPQTLLALAAEAQRNEDFEATERYLKEGLQHDTDVAMFYSALADMESRKGNYQQAMEQIDQGLENVIEEQRLLLLLAKADVQIDSGDITGAEATIREFERETQIQTPRVEFQRARILAAREQWLQASRALEDVRAKLVGDLKLQTQCDLLLGLAYQKIGYNEKALEVLERLVRQNPGNSMVDGMYRNLLVRTKGRPAETNTNASSFEARLRAELDKPEAEQDWQAFDEYIDEWAEANNRSEVQTLLFKAQVMVGRKKYAEARKLLQDAYGMAKDDLSVQRAAVRLFAVDPEGGPEKALALLDRTVENFGDQRLLRLDRADLYLAMNQEALVDELLSLTEGIDDWDRSDQVELWKGVAIRLNRAGKREEAEDAWKKVAELNPADLPTLMQVFEFAVERNDDAAMQAAQKNVLDLVGSKKDANYAFTVAARTFVQYRNDPENEKLRDEIFEAVQTALDQRPDWSAPYILRAQVKVQDREYLDALSDFREGFQRGRGDARALSQYVKLLNAQGSYRDALEQLEPFSPSVNVLLVGRLYPQLLAQAGRFRDAAEAAERLATSENAQKNTSDQLWYGQFMESIGRATAAPEDLRDDCQQKAGEALANAVELGPEQPGTWLAYITHLLTSGNRNEAEAKLREAQLTLEEDQQPILVAQCYENMGRWFDAENIYGLAYEENPDSDALAKQMALFYMSKRYPLGDGNAKAVALINDILRRFDEDPKSVSRANANWARRVAARMYASTGDYQNSLKAEKLLASNAENETLSLDDKTEMARILARRPEPVSRRKAIQLLEEIQGQKQLSPELDLALGQLYFTMGNWPKCRDHMATVRTRYPNSVAVRDSYTRMLLDRGGETDLRAAENQVRDLIRIAPQSLTTLELMSIVYDRTGDERRAKQAVRQMLPKDLDNLDDNGYRVVARVAQLLTAIEDLETAEQLYSILVRRPEASVGDQMKFVRFIGTHRDPERAFSMLDELVEDATLLAAAETGTSIIRTQRDEVGDRYDEKVEGWIDRAERDDPGSITASMARASLRDVQGRYEEAATIYRNVLDNERLAGTTKAAVLNNLAYLLALGAVQEQSPGESVKLLNQATEILGPISDILDTRACIWINRGEFQKAVDDMEFSVSDKPTGSKYFHKAQAHLGLGQNSQALAAWDKAETLGLTRESVGRLEEENYDRAKAKIEELKQRGGDL